MILHNLELEAFCHETEDEGGVLKAMLNLLPPEIRARENLPVTKDATIGTYGNQILVMRMDFKRQGDINGILKFIWGHLREEYSKGISQNLDERIDDSCNFCIRFGKQEAYRGLLKPGSSDSIQLRGKVAAFPANRENAISIIGRAWPSKT
ncbi:MAG: hypothetical protein JXB14_07215 [Candidatus Altiarchaeota archaeon]|nr:hypothetical protein [Candidatus Altiarchaeota archaeon]